MASPAEKSDPSVDVAAGSEATAPQRVFDSGLEYVGTPPAGGYYKPYEQFHQVQQTQQQPGAYGQPMTAPYPQPTYETPTQTYETPMQAGAGTPVPPSDKPRILGLRRTTFVLSVLLILVIIVAAVGGGVGGSMAVQNAKNDAVAAAAVTVTMTVTSGDAGAATTASVSKSGATASSRTATSATATAFVVPTNVVVALDCPNLDGTQQIISLGTKSYTYTVACNVDYNGADIDLLAITAYSLRDCLKACSSYNLNSNSSDCAAVEFNANLPTIVSDHFGSCFLKKGTGTSNTRVDNLHAGAALVGSK